MKKSKCNHVFHYLKHQETKTGKTVYAYRCNCGIYKIESCQPGKLDYSFLTDKLAKDLSIVM